MKRLSIEIIGWYGMLAILLAYALASFGVVNVNSMTYQLLNLTGAIGIVLVSWSRKVFQPAILNMVWALIAWATLWKIIF